MTSGSGERRGFALGIASYMLWGFLPIYWHALSAVASYEILANRILWSVVFVLVLNAMRGEFRSLKAEVQKVLRSPKLIVYVLCAGLLITFNWGIYIWAVNHEKILETSMGYYINPLVNVLLGVLVLGERLSIHSKVAIICAALGVGIMFAGSNASLLIPLGLAISFALYGLIKKKLPVATQAGLLLETSAVLPFAAFYLSYLSLTGQAAYQNSALPTLALLAGAGVVTALPLLLFTAAAKLLPLSSIGFLQYISPTLSLLIGVFLYGEAFTPTHFYAFGCIWLGLIVFTLGQLRNR